MTSDGDALFRAVCEQPAEDTPRLVYADWLEENGQSERAEFIRLQCEAWNLCPAYPTLDLARRREFELAREHGDRWHAELPAVAGLTWSGLFVRGFIDAVQAEADNDGTADRLAAAFGAAPLRRLILDPLDQSRLPRLLELPHIGRLAVLKLPRAERNSWRPIVYTDKSLRLLGAAKRRWPHVEFDVPRDSNR